MGENFKVMWPVIAFSLVNIATGFYWFGSINSEIVSVKERIVRIENRIYK